MIQILYILLLKAIIKTAIEKLANDIVKEAIELYMPERCRVKQNYRYERLKKKKGLSPEQSWYSGICLTVVT